PQPARQYSDPIAPVTITASDLDTSGSSLTASITSALPAGLALALSVVNTTEGGPFPGGPPGSRAWRLSGAASVAPGTYPVIVTVSGGQALMATTVAVVVTAEDARATYSGVLFAATASASASQATVTLRATIQDITAVDPAADPNPGDVRNATVS